ncbi:MAG: T9SS type A sorting domain-containing protein [Bacteroidales bacterium]|nr:T9SS type A sorting domain-containing protein [Bacteroidales bacterium]
MRIKNFTLLFLMGLFGLFSTNLFAQEDATIAPENIKYWIGEGDNEVIFIVNWNNPDTALAWGYRFSGESVVLKTIMDDIAAADNRFGYTASGSSIEDVTFNNGELDLSLTEQFWVMFLVDGQPVWDYFDVQTIANGQYVKVGDTYCGTMVDPENWIYVWEKEVAAVYPYAEEATIDPSEILYWVGEGDNKAIFCVNWAEPEKAYAWGYRFSSDNVTVEKMMDDIAAADGRFNYEGGGGMVMEITLDINGVQLALTGDYWMYNVNGSMAWYGYNEQTVVDGDFVKFGDVSCAVEIAEWTYVWTTYVTPVPVYNTNVNENADIALALNPNPATSFTMLNTGNRTESAVVMVSDLQGRTLSRFAAGQGDEPIRIETSGLSAGIYFVTVSDANARQTVKLTVK